MLKTKKKILASLGAAVLLLGAGCGQQQAAQTKTESAASSYTPVSWTENIGGTELQMKTTAPPSRAVSMSQATTEMLLALDLGDRMRSDGRVRLRAVLTVVDRATTAWLPDLSSVSGAPDAAAAPAVTAPATTDDDEPADKPAEEPKPALAPGAVTEIVAPLAGTVMPLDKVEDPVFSTGVVGQGAGISPADGKTIVVTAPAAGTLAVAPASGHAYGITLDSGVEVLIHVGLDTVNLGGKGFDVKVKQGDRVTAGQELVRVDRKTIEDAGYSLTTPVLITNTDKFASVEVIAEGEISPNAPLIRVTAPEG